jgi:hypothetical protein
MINRASIFENNLLGEMIYKSFVPSPLPPNPPIQFDDAMINALVKANKQLTLLNSLDSHTPNTTYSFLCIFAWIYSLSVRDYSSVS